MTDEDFIRLFGCDRDTYDKKLCENEYRILKERDNQYEESLLMESEDLRTLQNENPSDKLNTQEMIGVLFSESYGGCRISKEAAELYRKKKNMKQSEFVSHSTLVW